MQKDKYKALKNKKNRSKKTMIIVLAIIGILALICGILIAYYAWNNTTYRKRNADRVQAASYEDKIVTLSSGTSIHYSEGPANGPALLLLHGQASSRATYNRALPELAKHFHVYAIDIAGHGDSSRTPGKYTISKIGKDIVEFIQKTIQEPVYLSGHSSGGLIAAWIAANHPDLVSATLYEDPPFFSTEKKRMPQQFNYVDLARPAHDFLNQTEETDFASYYMEHNAWIKYFGKGGKNITSYAQKYRKNHPNSPINLWFFPPKTNETYADMHQFDPRFADAFYDYSWFDDFNQEGVLKNISQPSILVHANWRITDKHILEGAMTDDDASKACKLMKNCRIERVDSGHNFHFEKPEEFVRLMRSLQSVDAKD